MNIKKDSYSFSEVLSFLNTLFNSLAMLHIMTIAMEAIMDQTIDIISSVMLGRNVKMDNTL